jgi:hypothetical protein
MTELNLFYQAFLEQQGFAIDVVVFCSRGSFVALDVLDVFHSVSIPFPFLFRVISRHSSDSA